ncbi:3'-5' exonuclease [Roseivirga sp.]|uniref:3'-5' exonuclease n=1 Tax=Roseivirga sp. TaxID=1964215 RepID=UPI003B524C67
MNNDFLKNILFLDIETVPEAKSFHELPERKQALWKKKALFFREAEDKTPEELYERAGIYSEFGKIVVIAVGYFSQIEPEPKLRITAIANHDEKLLLKEFADLLNSHFDKKETRFCAHNGKEFDFPYIGRRMLIQGIPLPKTLQLSGKKPWEVPHLDTLELWKFGDYKHYTSLDLLASIFEIESSKDDIDGSQVNGIYYQMNDLDRIVKYCKKDVAVLVQVFLKMNQLSVLRPENITIV